MTSSNARLHMLLVHVLTEHDRQQSSKRSYNRYALPQYIGALLEVFDEVGKGEHLEAALAKYFEGRLLAKLLKLVGKAQ